MINHDSLKNFIALSIHKSITAEIPNCNITLAEIINQISVTPQIKLGHFSFPCFSLAKLLKKSPPSIAQTLAENISTQSIFNKCLATGPYLNFKLKLKDLGNVINEINNGEYFRKNLTSHHPRIMFEYSQPNTHKTMHVGHMRNLSLGNSLVRLNKYLQHDVIAVTYPGDSGAHVAKCLWYLKYHTETSYLDIKGTNIEKGAWLGGIYTLANLKLEDEKETEHFENNKKQLTQILKELEHKSGEYYDIWKVTKEWSFDLMKAVYAWADVKFDRWFTESEVDKDSLELMKKYYAQNLLIKDQGAIGMDLKDDNLGFCLLVKSDGTGLYSTKDIELARKKFEEFNIEKNIYVVDNRQTLHFKQVFKVLEKVGFKQAKDCYHLQYDVVELPDGAMSSRSGNIIPLMDLITKMEQTIISRYLEKYRDDWSDTEITETASMIANGAIKYGMIRIDNNRKIVFDMDEWLKLEGETGPYLQYVHARIYSLLQKSQQEIPADINWDLLVAESEQALMIKLSQFNHCIILAAEQLKTATLCSYLYDLGKQFNTFYAACPINKAPTSELKSARLALATSVLKVMQQGLSLLGIQAPLKM